MPEVFRKYLDQTKKSPSSVLFLNNANSVPSRGQVPGSKKKKMFLSSVCLDRRFWCCIISKKKSNFKHTVSRKKQIRQIKVETNEIENRKIIKSIKPESSSLDQYNL